MPPIGFDLLLLTWHVTRPFYARCLVPCRPLCYRPGPSDLAHPSIHSLQWGLPTSSHRSHDLVSGSSKSIPTIRGPGEQASWDLDSISLHFLPW
ncbi:unnamed protein product [Staurois parvus]|uniref:Secreted protein n=1 Tax=Staurois parvus TaxID=386267 RepID=A0ABN9H838_9NEOB|nr:unnamed protein product [Staurois parvus]